jgi:hypothetical protein
MTEEPEAPAASPWRIVWGILLGALALANVGFEHARVVDAAIAACGQMPPFTLLLPNWVQPESRTMQLAVLLTVPALSMLLPLALMAPGAIGFVQKRGPGLSWIWPWPVILLAVGFLLLSVNVLCAHVPELAEGAIYRLTCPGRYMVIPGAAVAAGILGHALRRGEGKLGVWMTMLLALGGACLVANAITTYVICHAVPSM